MPLENVERVLNMYNYFDSVIVTDEKGVIRYYTNMRTDVYRPDCKEIVGRSILKLHPELTEETSSIMQVLRTGKPIYDQLEHFSTIHGQCVTNQYSTLPLIQDGKVVGAVDLARCVSGNERQNVVLPSEGHHRGERRLYHLEDIISSSAVMKGMKMQIPQIANTDSSVLIYGETGTGKELVAQAIHTSSNRHGKPFISQNCAAIPGNLLESIVFGTVKGSYTGAENRSGIFEAANGGTVFLDEINSMELSMQAKILKVIEEKAVTRLGDTRSVPIDVKIISALNMDPIQCVEKRLLREDLFYRLNVVHIDIPPLRERLGDILYLTDHFIRIYNQRMNRAVRGVTAEVQEIFLNYRWPGNVRELQNTLEGVFNIISGFYIEKKDIPHYIIDRFEKEYAEMRWDDESKSLEERVNDFERRLVLKALDSSDSIVEAARKLRISKQGLNYKMKKFNLK